VIVADHCEGVIMKKGCIGLACLLPLTAAELKALGGEGPAKDARVSAWLYPEVNFQDGRSREADGRVWPENVNGHAAGGDPDDLGPFHACFAEGYEASVEEWEALNRALSDGYTSRYNASDRWSGGSNGSPISLTWSFVPDGVSISDSWGTGGSVLFSRMDTLFGAANRQTWINQFVNSFNRWATLSGITYTRVTASGQAWDDGAAWGTAGNDTTRGDIRIGMKTLDGSGGVLAYNSFPDNGDMVLDQSENWASGSPSYLFLRNVVMHENGHGLGFAHVCPANATKLMEPFVSTSYDGPRQDEVRGVHHFYGDPNEPNNTSSTATDLGTLNPGTTTTIGTIPSPSIPGASLVSLHPSDTDYYKLNLDTPRLVDITLTPNGTTYTDLDQNGDGSCQTTPTNNTNALAIANLQLVAYMANGTTELRNQNATAAGSAETISGLLLSNGLTYVRAMAAAAATQTQCYTLSITVRNTNLMPSASDGTFTEFVRVTWPAIPDATGYIVMRNTTNSQTGAASIGSVDGSTLTFDDTTAVPGTVYYYFVRVQQPGNTVYRYTTLTGDPGFRGVANQPPVANAGADQVVHDLDNNLSEMVTLNGSGSSDPDGTIVNYLWQEGTTTLANSASPTANVNLGAGAHTITLTVTDDDGATDSDDVTVIVNRRPTANAGPDAVIDDLGDDGSEAVTLDGSASGDPDGSINNYLWVEGTTTLANGPDSTPTVVLGWGAHTISLTVTDNRGATHSDSVVVTLNRIPVANAGPDQTLTDSDNNGTEPVTLNGSASSDPDGSIVNYLWQEGTMTLASGSSPVANVTLGLGVHTITLTVTDNRGSTGTDSVLVTINPGAASCDADVNCDGSADGFDVEVMEQAVGGDMSNFCQADPDFNRDGSVDGFDVEAVEQVVGGGPCP
jgi:hypothetical protein